MKNSRSHGALLTFVVASLFVCKLALALTPSAGTEGLAGHNLLVKRGGGIGVDLNMVRIRRDNMYGGGAGSGSSFGSNPTDVYGSEGGSSLSSSSSSTGSTSSGGLYGPGGAGSSSDSNGHTPQNVDNTGSSSSSSSFTGGSSTAAQVIYMACKINPSQFKWNGTDSSASEQYGQGGGGGGSVGDGGSSSSSSPPSSGYSGSGAGGKYSSSSSGGYTQPSTDDIPPNDTPPNDTPPSTSTPPNDGSTSGDGKGGGSSSGSSSSGSEGNQGWGAMPMKRGLVERILKRTDDTSNGLSHISSLTSDDGEGENGDGGEKRKKKHKKKKDTDEPEDPNSNAYHSYHHIHHLAHNGIAVLRNVTVQDCMDKGKHAFVFAYFQADEGSNGAINMTNFDVTSFPPGTTFPDPKVSLTQDSGTTSDGVTGSTPSNDGKSDVQVKPPVNKRGHVGNHDSDLGSSSSDSNLKRRNKEALYKRHRKAPSFVKVQRRQYGSGGGGTDGSSSSSGEFSPTSDHDDSSSSSSSSSSPLTEFVETPSYGDQGCKSSSGSGSSSGSDYNPPDDNDNGSSSSSSSSGSTYNPPDDNDNGSTSGGGSTYNPPDDNGSTYGGGGGGGSSSSSSSSPPVSLDVNLVHTGTCYQFLHPPTLYDLFKGDEVDFCGWFEESTPPQGQIPGYQIYLEDRSEENLHGPLDNGSTTQPSSSSTEEPFGDEKTQEGEGGQEPTNPSPDDHNNSPM